MGGDSPTRWALNLLRATLRWGWTREEVDQTISAEQFVFSAVLYGGMAVVSVVAGAVLWLQGDEETAIVAWIVLLGLTGMFGTIALGWTGLVLVTDRMRGEEAPDPGPRRDLAPDLTVARDTKISFVVTVILLALLAGVVFVARIVG